MEMPKIPKVPETPFRVCNFCLIIGNLVWQDKNVHLGKGSIVSADGMLYLRGSKSGTMVLIEATPEGWMEKGRFEQPDRSEIKADTPPVIAGGKLFVRDQDILLIYDICRFYGP